MSNQLFTNLEWLPRPPADFSGLCKRSSECDEDWGRRVRSLAGYSLDPNQLDRLARLITTKRASGHSLAPLIPLRLGLLSNSTLDLLVPALVASGARHGLAIECIVAGYDQGIQEALSPSSVINREKPDAVLIALDYRSFSLRGSLGDKNLCEGIVRSALAHLEVIRSGLKNNGHATCLMQTLAAPPDGLFGHLDRALAGTPRNLIDSINQGIIESILGTDDVLMDVAALAETVGLAEWHSPREWNLAKLPFSYSVLPLYAEHIARVLAALRGKSRRCLVLDLDNTLWGGVIGDDGLGGIQLGQGDALGEAHLAVQQLALSLRERGVVLAVCSKNDESNARLPFRKHPDMLLREEHIAVFKANWNDKASNLRAIAEEIGLGLESLVFLDDSPFERELVRQMLPAVAVPELPSDPALFPRTLMAAGYFESISFSKEDAQRGTYYQSNAQRRSLQQQASDLESYLASLRMEITFQPFDKIGRARITQLINKSNQFNLTTRRYSEAEVANMERDPAYFTLQVRLEDIFGDNGMISVVICREDPCRCWEIDTWLMSCRVLGRGVETMVLQELWHNARQRNIRKLVGVYIPTERNQLVKDHYLKLGFTQLAQEENGRTHWELDIETASVAVPPMIVHRCEPVPESHALEAVQSNHG
jgi:FkbH-like protein